MAQARNDGSESESDQIHLVDLNLRRRLAKVVDLYRKRDGFAVSLSDVGRRALAKGLDLLEADLKKTG